MATFYRSCRKGLVTGLLTLIVAGSANASDHNQTMGMVIGAAAGGLLGAQIGDGGNDSRRHDRDYRGRRADYKSYRDRDNRRWRYDHPRDNGRYYSNRRPDNFRYYRQDYPSRAYYRRDDDSAQLFATAAGIFFGALVGSEIGRYMDEVDRMQARDANTMAQSAPVGTQIAWSNPQSRNAGTIAATRDGYSETGKYCREFYQTVSIGGRTEDAYGVACRQPDGAWRIVQ